MQQNTGAKRASALNKLKRSLPPQTPQSGPPRFSAATSHEQNDAYMQDFDKAYAELEALNIGNRAKTGGIAAHRANARATQKAAPATIINWQVGEVVVGSSDHALYVVDIATGEKRRTLYTKTAGHSEWVTACQYLPDGRIISGGMDSQLCLWEANSNRCQQLSAHAAPISAVDVSHATGAVVSASYDKSVRVWNVASRRASESSCLSGHTAPVLQLVCGSGDNVLSADRGGTVIMWGLGTGNTSKLKDAHTGHVTALAWQYDSDGACTDNFFSGGQDGHLRMWDPRQKGCVHDIAAHVNSKGKGAVGNIISAGAASNNCVVTAGADSTVKAFDVRCNLQPVCEAKLTDFPYSMAVAGGLALAGCGDGSLLVIDIKASQTLYGLGANKHAVRGIHPSDKSLVCLGDDGSVYIYDYAR